MVSPLPFYIVGIAVVLVAFLTLGRWIQGLTGRRNEKPMSVLGAAVLAFLVGSATIVVGIQFDNTQSTIENTRTFVYTVSVHLNGTAPILLRLPAPADERVFSLLNMTNGTSSMRLNRTASSRYVEVYATDDVVFIARTEFVGFAFNRSLSRVFLEDLFFRFSSSGNASVELIGDGSGTSTAGARLDVLYAEFCRLSELVLDAEIREGRWLYPVTYAVSTCSS